MGRERDGETTVDLLEGLSDEQRAVAEHDRGVALVCAVAGAGKTTTMCRRIARLMARGADGDRILAVTFTKAGASAMNDKLEALGVRLRKARGDGGVRVGTFHSLCLEIIRDGSPWKGYEVDDADKLHYCLKDILGYRVMNWAECDLTDVAGFIGWAKNEAGVTAAGRVDPGVLAEMHARFPRWRDPRYNIALEKLEAERHKRRLLSFDDMLATAVLHLDADAGARARWGARYQHVMVDEFQDTNRAQMRLVDHLVAGAESFMAIGDDDQLIYAWRGSRSEYTLGFEAAHPGSRLYFMQANYRSRPEVLAPANRAIAVNVKRIAKSNAAQREAGGLVEVSSCANSDDEANHVAAQIRDGVAGGRAYRDHAVLYRTNALSRALEEAFIRDKIPHVVVGGTSFYDRKEVADLLAYLRLAHDPMDEAAFSRAVNRPFRYIGKQSVEKLVDAGKKESEGPLGACANPPRWAGLQYRQERSVREFAGIVRGLRDAMNPGPGFEAAKPDALLSKVLDETDYLAWLARDEGTDTAENSRVSNVKELVRTAGRFATVAALLEYVDSLKAARKAKPDEEGENKRDVVLLMTIHKAKGLEWPVVFLAGCSQGILPHARAEDVEEERRLFYVAVTRAREECRISCPIRFGVGGEGAVRDLPPSQFVGEAGLALVSHASAPGAVDAARLTEALTVAPIGRTGELAARLDAVEPLLVPAQGEMAEESRQNGLDTLVDEAAVFASPLEVLEEALGPQEPSDDDDAPLLHPTHGAVHWTEDGRLVPDGEDDF